VDPGKITTADRLDPAACLPGSQTIVHNPQNANLNLTLTFTLGDLAVWQKKPEELQLL
jgi:hypothetical protein